MRGKKGSHPIRHTVHRLDRVAGERADAFVTFMNVRFRDRLAVLLDRSEAPIRFSADRVHEVHHMAAEHPEILGTAAKILFATPADFDNSPNPSILKQIADDLELRA